MKKRSGQSAACVIPILGVTSISNVGSTSSARTVSGPETRLEPFSLRVMPMACVSRPGPDARSAILRAAGRRLRMIGMPLSGSSRANQNAPGQTLGLRYEVKTFMHAVDEVDVGPSRRSENYARAVRDTAPGVRRPIAGAEISFHFHDPSGSCAVDENLAQACARHFDRRPRIEALFQHARCGN